MVGAWDYQGVQTESGIKVEKVTREVEVQCIIAWAEQHAGLQQVLLQKLPPVLAAAAAAACSRRPGLRFMETDDPIGTMCGYHCADPWHD